MLRYAVRPRIKRTPVDLERNGHFLPSENLIVSRLLIDNQDYAVRSKLFTFALGCSTARIASCYSAYLYLRVTSNLSPIVTWNANWRARGIHRGNIILRIKEPRGINCLAWFAMYHSELSYFKIRLSRVIPYSGLQPESWVPYEGNEILHIIYLTLIRRYSSHVRAHLHEGFRSAILSPITSQHSWEAERLIRLRWGPCGLRNEEILASIRHGRELRACRAINISIVLKATITEVVIYIQKISCLLNSQRQDDSCHKN